MCRWPVHGRHREHPVSYLDIAELELSSTAAASSSEENRVQVALTVTRTETPMGVSNVVSAPPAGLRIIDALPTPRGLVAPDIRLPQNTQVAVA